MSITPEWVQAIAAIATLFAALVALKIAAAGPERSARFAEQYRRENREADERDNLKRLVLHALLKCRVTLMHQDALAAINLVDVAFLNSKQVRSARDSFMAAASAVEHQPAQVVERYHALINSVIREMGLGDHLSEQDVQNGYYPRLMGTLDDGAIADAEEKIARRAATRPSEFDNPEGQRPNKGPFRKN